MVVEVVEKITKIDDKYIYGETYHDDILVTTWSKMTDQYYTKVFWFLEDLDSKFGIDRKISKTIQDIFSEHPVDYINYFGVLLLLNDSKRHELNKFLMGPLSHFINKIPYPIIFKLLEDNELTYSEKSDIINDCLSNELFDYNELRNKHKKQVIEENLIEGDIDILIMNNQDQWKKAGINSNIINWFVGQFMKTQTQKIDASVVRSILIRRLENDNTRQEG